MVPRQGQIQAPTDRVGVDGGGLRHSDLSSPCIREAVVYDDGVEGVTTNLRKGLGWAGPRKFWNRVSQLGEWGTQNPYPCCSMKPKISVPGVLFKHYIHVSGPIS